VSSRANPHATHPPAPAVAMTQQCFGANALLCMLLDRSKTASFVTIFVTRFCLLRA
jgi:hypothetical protein